ncbi:hypothetical protein [Rhodovulum steppense]|uniref:hypothetical protein n=1 Tax=Rhodovulum steppense TaxID=540251 RepID=UPI001404E23A|nr:hypothetical protein [Rhodovulum steppense]
MGVLARYAVANRRHIMLENTVILPLSRQRLRARDLRARRARTTERCCVAPATEGRFAWL